MYVDYCRYCGAMFARNILRHESVCPDNPSVMAKVRAMVDDGTGRIINREVYDAMPDKPVSSTTLRHRFGGWQETAKALGLIHGNGLDAPLTEAERYCCQRRLAQEQAYYPSK
jgi:hypothetical protein